MLSRLFKPSFISKQVRPFSSGIKISPYFSLSAGINDIKLKYASEATTSYALETETELFNQGSQVKTGGRIIGRRKASSGLMFLDIESNGETMQVMLNKTRLTGLDFKEVAAAC
jgi:lysyl-tRNA synthetase class II